MNFVERRNQPQSLKIPDNTQMSSFLSEVITFMFCQNDSHKGLEFELFNRHPIGVDLLLLPVAVQGLCEITIFRDLKVAGKARAAASGSSAAHTKHRFAAVLGRFQIVASFLNFQSCHSMCRRIHDRSGSKIDRCCLNRLNVRHRATDKKFRGKVA
jgi:hypothetical protein